MVRGLALISVSVLVVAAALGAASGHAEHRVVQPISVAGLATDGTDVGAATRIVGGSGAQRRLLREILASLGPTDVRQLRLVRVHGGVKLQAPAQAVRGVFDRAAFEAWVVGAAFFYRSADQRLPHVVEVSAGQVGFPTNNAGPRPPRATASSVAATRRQMHRLVLASGAHVVNLAVRTPDALAVVLRVRVNNAARFLQDRLRDLVLGARAHETRYDGLLVEVDDARGVAWASANTPLGGEEYRNPSLRRYDPFPPPGPQALGQPGRVRIRRASSPSASSRA
jgi:hypothetical protein